eukprot:GFYU01014808.1.p1 GENE.GFYU01014808.1~~GFYU01014808.1.p1  ORF type:complete len:643 (+),score=128.23 GFYU01014808.1:145-2073(+)
MGTTTCSVCCQIATFTVDITGLPPDFTILYFFLAFIVLMSMLILVYRLNKAYEDSYRIYNRPIRRLLGKDNERNTLEQKGTIAPAYYTFCQIACLFFVVQMICYFPVGESTFVTYIQTSLFAMCCGFDNFIIAYLCQTKHEGSGKRSMAWAALSIILLGVFAIALSVRTVDCPWCGIHYPTPYIVYPYLGLTVMYAVLVYLSMYPPTRSYWFLPSPRPPMKYMGCTLLWGYGWSSLGLFVNLYSTSGDAGYCFMYIGLSGYTLVYAWQLYKTILADSKFHRQRQIIGALGYDNPSDLTEELLEEDADGELGIETLERSRKSANLKLKPGPQDTMSVEETISLLRKNTAFAQEFIRFIDTTDVRFIHYKSLQLKRRIGVGGYGEVHQGEWKGSPVAVKTLFVFGVKDDVEALQEFLREVHILNKLRHPNILDMYGVCIDAGHQAIVTEFMNNGSVYDVMHKQKQKLTLAEKLSILQQTCRGMEYLHAAKPPIIHRDLKSQNLLLDEHFTIKVCDFGLSRSKETTATMTAIGTTQWAAPEVLRREKYSEKADVYSYGMILWEIMSGGAEIFPDKWPPQVIAQVVAGIRPDMPESCPRSIADMIHHCWHQEDIERPSFAEVMAGIDEMLSHVPDLEDEVRSHSAP